MHIPSSPRYFFRQRTSESLIKFPNEVSGQPFSLEELEKCDVSVLDYTETMTIRACRGGVIRCGPTVGVCKVSECSECVLEVACGHLIVTECDNLIVYLYTATEPEVERSNGILFAPYNLSYAGLGLQFSHAGLDPRKNFWSRVRADGEYDSVWALLPVDQFSLDKREIRGLGPAEDIVPRPPQYGGTLTGELLIGSQERSARSILKSPRKPLPNTDEFAFKYLENEEELIKNPGEIAGHVFSLEDLRACSVSLLDYTEALEIRVCKDTTIRCGPTKTVCQISDCTGCIITVACDRLVIKDCFDLIVFVYAAKEPVMERSKQITFAPYNLAYAGLREQFRNAGLEPRRNLWSQVKTQEKYDEGWSLLPEEQFDLDIANLPGGGSPDDPVPRPEKYRGTIKGAILIGSQERVIQRGELPAPGLRQDLPPGGFHSEVTSPPVIIYEQGEQHGEQPYPPAESRALSPKPQSFPEQRYLSPKGYSQVPPEKSPRQDFNGKAPVSDLKGDSVVIAFDPCFGFEYASDDPQLASIPDIYSILKELSDQVLPHHLYLDMLKISLYALISGSLLLYLIVVLLLDFVDMHVAGLIINLIIVTGFLGGLGAMMVLRWKGRVRVCNEGLGVFLNVKKSNYDALGIEVTASIDRVTIKTHSP